MVRLSTGQGSKQDYRTPADFIGAVQDRFGRISFDLAAGAANTQAAQYYAAPDSNDAGAFALDSLAQDWVRLSHTLPWNTLMWLNPPFSRIEPWIEKCAGSAQDLNPFVSIGFLVPAAVGSNWFKDHAVGIGLTHFLNGRLCFDGINLFPKDCMFIQYGPRIVPGLQVWTWRKRKTTMICEGCDGAGGGIIYAPHTEENA